MNTEDNLILRDDPLFPWDDVEASRKNGGLQKKHPLSERENYISIAKPCPKCQTDPARLTWFYFQSPPWTWGEALCGRAGWLSVCDNCHFQVEFFEEVMS